MYYNQQRENHSLHLFRCCDLLENYYLCTTINNERARIAMERRVVICLKIITFVLQSTTRKRIELKVKRLWFAWKLLPLYYNQQQYIELSFYQVSCDLLENYYLCTTINNDYLKRYVQRTLWFAWKLLSLYYNQQRHSLILHYE